jgi:glycosyltransferase involved in cell wall biosynthesis
MRAIEQATTSLVSPRAAVDFLHRRVTPRIRYFGSGGVELSEFAAEFAEGDLSAFHERFADDGAPLILILGRKAGAKNYAMTLEARRLLAARGVIARIVMIGPDDDGMPINEPGVVYLGPQPRQVVRGALRAAGVLVNMSASESFGIVLLEAWLAGTPVVANRRCLAFTDLVDDGINGFLVDNVEELAERVAAMLRNPKLGAALAERGRKVAIQYAWSRLGDELDTICTQLVDCVATDRISERWGKTPAPGSS